VGVVIDGDVLGEKVGTNRWFVVGIKVCLDKLFDERSLSHAVRSAQKDEEETIRCCQVQSQEGEGQGEKREREEVKEEEAKGR